MGTDPLDYSRYTDSPFPVLFNPWKHHAGALRHRIAEVAADGEAALAALPGRLLVVGTALMDLYTGPRTPAEIGGGVLAALAAKGHLAPADYRAWVGAGGGYRFLTLAEDGSVWVLRAGEEARRYVHVHPGRRAPATRRVRATVLKTAVMALADAAVHGGDPLDVGRINALRGRHLGLPPIRGLDDEQGLRAVIELLLAPTTPPPSP
jgi:hypothetical protein